MVILYVMEYICVSTMETTVWKRNLFPSSNFDSTMVIKRKLLLYNCVLNYKSDYIYFYILRCLETHTPRRDMAACKSSPTSTPSTPEHLNPLVQPVSLALANPSCLQGKLNVNPRGSLRSLTLSLSMKFARHSAMWSNSYREVNKIVYCW